MNKTFFFLFLYLQRCQSWRNNVSMMILEEMHNVDVNGFSLLQSCWFLFFRMQNFSILALFHSFWPVSMESMTLQEFFSSFRFVAISFCSPVSGSWTTSAHWSNGKQTVELLLKLQVGFELLTNLFKYHCIWSHIM